MLWAVDDSLKHTNTPFDGLFQAARDQPSPIQALIETHRRNLGLGRRRFQGLMNRDLDFCEVRFPKLPEAGRTLV